MDAFVVIIILASSILALYIGYLLGNFFPVFRSKKAKFVYQLFQTSAYEKQVAADLGATINSINGTQLKKYKFPRLKI